MFVFILTAHSEDTGYSTSHLDNLFSDIENFVRLHLDDRLGYLNSKNERTYSLIRVEMHDTENVDYDQLILEDSPPVVPVVLIDNKGHRPAILTYDDQGDVIVDHSSKKDDA
jgi:hypothetical protein